MKTKKTSKGAGRKKSQSPKSVPSTTKTQVVWTTEHVEELVRMFKVGDRMTKPMLLDEIVEGPSKAELIEAQLPDVIKRKRKKDKMPDGAIKTAEGRILVPVDIESELTNFRG